MKAAMKSTAKFMFTASFVFFVCAPAVATDDLSTDYAERYVRNYELLRDQAGEEQEQARRQAEVAAFDAEAAAHKRKVAARQAKRGLKVAKKINSKNALVKKKMASKKSSHHKHVAKKQNTRKQGALKQASAQQDRTVASVSTASAAAPFDLSSSIKKTYENTTKAIRSWFATDKH